MQEGKKYSEDYHDYVFEDGKLLGDFENMYKYSKVTPWKQDEDASEWYAELSFLMLKDEGPFNEILEIGCGLGYFVDKLKTLGKTIDAFDISQTAINKAKLLHQGINFYVDDIRKEKFSPIRKYDLIVAKDLFWYVFNDLKQVIRSISKCAKKETHIYIYQYFPALDEPFVGKKIINSPEKLMDILVNGLNLEPIYSMLLRRYKFKDGGPILLFSGKKK